MDFLQSRSGSLSYKDLETYTNRLSALLKKGWPYRHRPVIGIDTESGDEFILTASACWILGIPFTPFQSAFLTKKRIEKSGADLFFGTSHKALRKFDSLNIPALSFHSIMITRTEGKSHMKQTRPPGDDSVFAYLHTSGSSGYAKRVPCRRRQIISNARQSAGLIRPDRNGLWLHCLPLNHIGGISIIMRSLVYKTGIYRLESFHAGEVSELIASDKPVEIISLVPTMLKRLLELPDFKPNKLKAVLLGGGPVPPGLLEEAWERGVPVVTGYGMTETCGFIAAQKYAPGNEGTGFVLKGNKAEIRDDNGVSLSPGNTGHIWLKGPQVFDGYDSGGKDSVCFDEKGWFKTGDFGSIDENGCLYIESKRTDLIITGGENVSPYEVEAVLNTFPQIWESAVTGISDSEWGQKLVALIVCVPDERPDLREVKSKLKERLQSFKIPKNICVVDSLPKTSLGKLERNKIRDQALRLLNS